MNFIAKWHAKNAKLPCTPKYTKHFKKLSNAITFSQNKHHKIYVNWTKGKTAYILYNGKIQYRTKL